MGSNVLGSLLGSREAVRIMRRQPPADEPAYHLWNLGFSPWGAKASGGPLLLPMGLCTPSGACAAMPKPAPPHRTAGWRPTVV